MEPSLLFDMFKAIDYIENNHKSIFFLIKDPFFFMRAQHVLSYHGVNKKNDHIIVFTILRYIECFTENNFS